MPARGYDFYRVRRNKDLRACFLLVKCRLLR